MRKKLLLMAGCLVFAYWIALACIVVHEGGHALATNLSRPMLNL